MADNVCRACKSPLPPHPGRGQPPMYCNEEETGRPCSRFMRALQACQSYANRVEAHLSGHAANNARLAMGGEVIAVGNDIKYNR